MNFVSVIIPMKNVAQYIERAIASVPQLKNHHVQIVCVDDGSIDQTVQTVKTLNDGRVMLISSPRRGISAARNAGIAAADGNILMFLDADDLFVPNGVAKVISTLDANPTAGAVGGILGFISETGTRVGVPFSRQSQEVVQRRAGDHTFLHVSACAYRKEAVDLIGGFREFFEVSEDKDFISRLEERVTILQTRIHLVESRIRAGSISRRSSWAKKQWYSRQSEVFASERRDSGYDGLMVGKVPPVPCFTDSSTTTSAADMELNIIMASAWWCLDRGELRETFRLTKEVTISRKYLALRIQEKTRLISILGVRLVKSIIRSGVKCL